VAIIDSITKALRGGCLADIVSVNIAFRHVKALI
jgi:hypothetical protein